MIEKPSKKMQKRLKKVVKLKSKNNFLGEENIILTALKIDQGLKKSVKSGVKTVIVAIAEKLLINSYLPIPEDLAIYMFSASSAISVSKSHSYSGKKGDLPMLPAIKGAIRFWQR